MKDRIISHTKNTHDYILFMVGVSKSDGEFFFFWWETKLIDGKKFYHPLEARWACILELTWTFISVIELIKCKNCLVVSTIYALLVMA